MEKQTVISGLSKTFYSPNFYKKLLDSKLKYSMKVVLAYLLFLTIIGGVLFYFFAVPKIEKYTTNFSQRISKVFPNDLVITIKNGEASINKPSPVKIPLANLEKQFTSLPANQMGRKNLLVIDIEGDIRKFEKYDTMFLLTKDNLAIEDNQSAGYRVSSLKTTSDAVIDQKSVKTVTKQFDPFIAKLPNIFLALSMPSIFIGIFITILVRSLITGLILMLIGEIINFKLPYAKHFQYALHINIISQTVLFILVLSPMNLALPYYSIWFPALIGALVYSDLNRTHLQEN